MIKAKRDYSKYKELYMKQGKECIIQRLGHQVYEDINRKGKKHSTRRRNRIKARRLIIKADCLECRKEYSENHIIDIDYEKAYQPFSEYICGECKWYMRAGRH